MKTSDDVSDIIRHALQDAGASIEVENGTMVVTTATGEVWDFTVPKKKPLGPFTAICSMREDGDLDVLIALHEDAIDLLPSNEGLVMSTARSLALDSTLTICIVDGLSHVPEVLDKLVPNLRIIHVHPK